MTSWAEWLVQARPALQRGEKVPVPTDIPPPPSAGFTQYTGPTENHGQIEDWVHPLENGSRLHAYKYADGRWFVHLDNYDPNVSLLYLVLHLGSETSVGKLALLGGLGYLGYRWARR